MPRPPRLKVYAAAAGFSEAVVAAPNQKAALEAWGAREDYFAHGLARQVQDEDTVAAALKQPGVVLKRPVGSAEAFVEAAKPPRRAQRAKAPTHAPEPPKPDRGPRDAAESALKAAKARLRDLERTQREERKALERAQATAREAAEAELSAAQTTLDEARAAFTRAGG